MKYQAHSSAVIEAGATVGDDTRVWHFCHIMPQAVIGSNCQLGQNVFVDNGASIGNGVKIQNNVSVYKGVVIGDDAFLGPSVVFTNVVNPRSFIERKAEIKATHIGRGATLGANATILCGISIGEYAMIGAGAVVIRTVPAYGLVAGNPAQQKGWVSRNGHPLVFDNEKAYCEQEHTTYYLRHNQVTIS